MKYPGYKLEIFIATQQLGYNEVAVQANLQVMPELKSGFLEVPFIDYMQ